MNSSFLRELLRESAGLVVIMNRGMARGQDRRDSEEEEKEDKDAGVSDDALDLIDEDEEDDFGMTDESDDDKGWE